MQLQFMIPEWGMQAKWPLPKLRQGPKLGTNAAAAVLTEGSSCHRVFEQAQKL